MSRLALIVATVAIAVAAATPTAGAVVTRQVHALALTEQLKSPATQIPVCTVSSTINKDVWRAGASSGCAFKTATAYSYIGGVIGSDNFGPGSPGYINPPSYVDIYRVRVIAQNRYGWYCIYDHYANGVKIRRSCNA